MTIGAMTNTMPNAQTTQPIMTNAGYDFTSITPVKTRGLTGKQATQRTVRSVAQRISLQLFIFFQFSPVSVRGNQKFQLLSKHVIAKQASEISTLYTRRY
jgi:hypothetical protein